MVLFFPHVKILRYKIRDTPYAPKTIMISILHFTQFISFSFFLAGRNVASRYGWIPIYLLLLLHTSAALDPNNGGGDGDHGEEREELFPLGSYFRPLLLPLTYSYYYCTMYVCTSMFILNENHMICYLCMFCYVAYHLLCLLSPCLFIRSN
jgi:hypothetical protein